jgi:shikimate kinase
MTFRPANLFLVGPTGSGKTTIGRRVAGHLGMQFVDCDEEIEQSTGASISLNFDLEGEDGFRQREAQVLAELAGRHNALVATGGGAVLKAENRRVMKAAGYVIWLQTSVEQQLQRLELDRQRPLLQTPDRRARLEEQARQRKPLYREVADLHFESDDHSARHMARELTRLLLAQWEHRPEESSHATS